MKPTHSRYHWAAAAVVALLALLTLSEAGGVMRPPGGALQSAVR